jgi:hypothetical protein
VKGDVAGGVDGSREGELGAPLLIEPQCLNLRLAPERLAHAADDGVQLVKMERHLQDDDVPPCRRSLLRRHVIDRRGLVSAHDEAFGIVD